MKERLIQLLDLEQLSPSKFADLIGVQRSSISHIISGRNKPSFDFLEKTLRAFPGLNASWLLLGEGSMYEQMGRNVPGNLFDSAEHEKAPYEPHISETDDPGPGISSAEEPVTAQSEPQPGAEGPVNKEETQEVPIEGTDDAKPIPGQKRIVQVMILYEDDTFKTFMPAH